MLTFDEVQSGFGRTGKFWAFEHYGVTPDLICCGKGISSGMPLSAVIGRQHIMDQFPTGSMTSTHTGNPVCCAAATANIKNCSPKTSPATPPNSASILHERCKAIQARHPSVIGHVTCAGLVAGLQTIVPGKKEPNHDPRTASSSEATSAACCSSPPSAPGARPSDLPAPHRHRRSPRHSVEAWLTCSDDVTR